jgi:hypothetical protein
VSVVYPPSELAVTAVSGSTSHRATLSTKRTDAAADAATTISTAACVAPAGATASEASAYQDVVGSA